MMDDQTKEGLGQDDGNFHNLIYSPEVLSEIPIHSKGDPTVKTEVTSTEWAEVMDETPPMPELKKKLINMGFDPTITLDNFQEQAISKLEEGYHVFVGAPTSSGKTMVAEFAIALSKKNGTRAIYTSPTKTLSNQKYKDFKKLFTNVGLLTGDIQLNKTAPCLVMTTEILRSMLYCGSEYTKDLEFVIFDEIHYINNPERGYVWEEAIILLPPHVRIVMLSATVPNSLQFADWVGRIKKRKVYVVSTPKRSVPLFHYLYTGSGQLSKHDMFLIVNPKGKFQVSRYNEAATALKFRPCEYHYSSIPIARREYRDPVEHAMWVAFMEHLEAREALPVVVFTLSRYRCFENANYLMSVVRTNQEEKKNISSCFHRRLKKVNINYKEVAQVCILERLLLNGIGVHHSGILPYLKKIVEELFQCGLVKILFATETFALGVNMPVHTVIFDKVTKYDGWRVRTLEPSEYIQMAGRAGRRGIDKSGSVIILCRDSVPDLTSLRNMMIGTPQMLSSQFRLTYGMILNLLRISTVSVEDMMQQSFREIHQADTTDRYRNQLKIAEMECSQKCGTPLAQHLSPLAAFYDAAMAYIDVFYELMPIILKQSTVVRFMKPGRVLVVSAGPYINQLGLLLEGNGAESTPYKVLALDNIQPETGRYNFVLNEYWYKTLGFSAQYDKIGAPAQKSTPKHVILCLAPKNIVAITKTKYKIDTSVILRDWKRRQMPGCKDNRVAVVTAGAVKKLARASALAYTGGMIAEIPLTHSDEVLKSLDNMAQLKVELNAQKKHTDIANFVSEFAIVYDRKQAERKRDKYKRLLSIENLALYPEYQGRLMVLRKLKYIDEQNNVTRKGEAACCIKSSELIISELIFRKVFSHKTPIEIASVLTCFVFCAKGYPFHKLPQNITRILKSISKIDTHLRTIENKYMSGSWREYPNTGLVKMVYDWALNEPFWKIVVLMELQEGVVLRCLQQLHELLMNVKDAAAVIGDVELQEKMVAASKIIKRVSSPPPVTT